METDYKQYLKDLSNDLMALHCEIADMNEINTVPNSLKNMANLIGFIACIAAFECHDLDDTVSTNIMHQIMPAMTKFQFATLTAKKNDEGLSEDEEQHLAMLGIAMLLQGLQG